MMEWLYEDMKRNAIVPYDIINNSPMFAVMGSSQTLARMYRDDPELRQDLRFSSLANANVAKYNLVSAFRDMYLSVPILTPRRFNIIGGVPREVNPNLNGIPMEYGSFTGPNPAYSVATHEEIIFTGKHTFDIYTMPTAQTLGHNTSFGPEATFLDQWQWVNVQSDTDPMRRVGYFVSHASVGFGAPNTQGQVGILVERASQRLAAVYNPTPMCPTPDPVCSNSIPLSGCPCPLIEGYSMNPFAPNTYTINLSQATLVIVGGTIQFGLDNGGFIVGTVTQVSVDGFTVAVTFPAGTELGICDRFTELFCVNDLVCETDVVEYGTNAADNTRIDLVLSSPLRAFTAANVITLRYGNGTTQSATIVTANMTTNLWVVDIGAGVFPDNVGGVVGICVPTATIAACPGCGGITSIACSVA
jgi:hypothetical protein